MPAIHLSRRDVLQAAALAALPLAARSQTAWPSKPVRLVVPFAPGGSSDIVARAVAAEMAKTLGQNVFVENKPGAAGNIAMQEVANSTDEHAIILGHIGTRAVNPYIFPKLPYDANRDFVGNSSAEFAQFIAAEQKRWSQVVARAQIKPEGMG